MKYKLISVNSKSVLEEMVNDHLKNGWKLHGDTIIVLGAGDEDVKIYNQAMTYQEVVLLPDGEA
jgi:hypothetical protein